MKQGGGRQKGNRFELTLARILSIWWKQPDANNLPAKELWFRRVPMSGGFDKRKAGGDIWSVVDEAQTFPFSLEAKNREEWSWDGLFKRNEKWPVLSYWEQCCGDATRMKKVPLLVFTKNRHPVYFAVNQWVASELGIGSVVDTQTRLVFGLFDQLIAIDPEIIISKIRGDYNAE